MGIAAALTLGGCTGGGQPADEPGIPNSPEFQEASVHDPSILLESGTYYVFGSHLMSAKSDDLMSWTQISNGVRPGNPLIPDPFEEMKEALQWAETQTFWAADVIRLADGKYYMYYNACRGDSPRSALGLAVADQIEGPYEDLGLLLRSGMDMSEPLPDGSFYDATIHPNTVDPDVFFDADGKLWMVYGSYSGGIYILALDPETGKPLEGQGYGKKLLGGNHSRIEAPYMLYSPETKYYYLFLSYGGLTADGGYQIRVARSEKPDGPFTDATGQAMLDAKGAEGTIFDDRSIEPYGVKLVGNFEWEESNGYDGNGYVSPGHNSAYYDEESGKAFLVFHTRFPGRGEAHEVRVHQMAMNSEGWPVMLPGRYAEELIGVFEADTVAGDYLLLNHGQDITAEIKRPVPIRLHEDGTVSGSAGGEWSFVDGSREFMLELEDGIYRGVFARVWDESKEAFVPAFSVLSKEGSALWGRAAAQEEA
nr:glycoside hydrolase family 43 protein [Paenibacillus soyae]